MTSAILSPFLEVLVQDSAQAGALVLLILLVQRLCGRRLAPRWRCALWALVAIRLLLPFSLPADVSIFNLVPHAIRESFVKPTAAPWKSESRLPMDPEQAGEMTRSSPMTADPVAAIPSQPATAEPGLLKRPAADKTPYGIRSWQFAALGVWLLGVVVLGGHLVLTSITGARRFRRLPSVSDPGVLQLLDECRAQMELRIELPVVESPDVSSPALHGLFRPRLLLPERFTQAFSLAELRLVFLHELSHVKRRDIWWNWLAAILQVAHWFNPLLWLGLARWRADRELACDALTLEVAGAEHSKEYGRTILRMLANFVERPASPGLVGILEDRRQLKRRIAMIADYSSARPGPTLAMILTALLAAVALTDAQSPNSNSGQGVPPTSSTTGRNTASNANIAASTNATLRGQIINEDGYPVPEVVVGNKDTPQRTITGDDGRFVLEGVPALGNYYISKLRHLVIHPESLPAGDTNHVITLRRTIRLRGTVLDAVTRKPVPTFSVVPGSVYSSKENARWRWQDRQEGSGGQFDFAFKADSFFMVPGGQLLVEADGYAPAESKIFDFATGEHSLELLLSKADQIRGVVLQPDGQPAKAAETALWTGELNWADIPYRRRDEADPAGRFFLPTGPADFVIITHSSGYAEVTPAQLRANPEVRIRPGGKVSGTVRLAGRAVSGQRVSVHPIMYKFERQPFPDRSHGATGVKTDPSGRFSIAGIPEGDYWLAIQRSRRVDFGDSWSMSAEYSHRLPIEVRSGATIEVNLGGTGQKVVGHATIKGDLHRAHWPNCYGALQLKLPPVPGRPDIASHDYPPSSRYNADANDIAFWRSSEGKARQRAIRIYLATFDGDGSFRFEDIPPGDYRLTVEIFDPADRQDRSAKDRFTQGGTYYHLNRDVTVPGQAAEPIDLGYLELGVNQPR